MSQFVGKEGIQEHFLYDGTQSHTHHEFARGQNVGKILKLCGHLRGVRGNWRSWGLSPETFPIKPQQQKSRVDVSHLSSAQ